MKDKIFYALLQLFSSHQSSLNGRRDVFCVCVCVTIWKDNINYINAPKIIQHLIVAALSKTP